VDLKRIASAPLLAILSCAALIAGAPSTAAAAARAHTSCAKHSSPARRACRSHARKARVRDTPKSHTVKPHVSKVHASKSRPGKTHRVKSAPTPAAAPETAAEAQPASGQHSAATIAAVLATPCPNTELTPEAGNMLLIRAAILCLINRKRAEDNESPLVTNPDLERAAESHCEELIADDYFAHVSPSGETPVERIRDTGYVPGPSFGYVIGENLAWGTYQLSTPQAIASAWFASPGHLANILEAQYQETGIAITPAVPSSLAPGATGATYAQEFGVLIP
jgi:uncharacterized protein YkwD